MHDNTHPAALIRYVCVDRLVVSKAEGRVGVDSNPTVDKNFLFFSFLLLRVSRSSTERAYKWNQALYSCEVIHAGA